MRNMAKYIFICVLTFVLFCPAVCFAQSPKIATDYGTCLQGVKDSTGKWIIAPRYENIDYDYCGYIVSDTGKYGVIDRKGRVLVPMIYDYVRPAYHYYRQDRLPHQYFMVIIGENYGVVDTTNKVIVPVRFQNIVAYEDTVFAAKPVNDQWYFYHVDGSAFAAPWKEYSNPIRRARHCYSMSRRRWFGYKYGLCDDSGHVLLEAKYDYFEGDDYTNCLRVLKKDKYGFCSAAGQFIWPISFSHGKYPKYGSVYNDVLELSCGPAWIGDKCGMINMKGDTLLPFIYDNIYLFNGYPRTKTGNLWVVKQGDLLGIYSGEEGWKIPVACSEITTVGNYYADSDSSQVGLLIYRKGKLWGSMTSGGQEVLPCVYDEFIKTQQNEYIFSAGDSLISLCIRTYGSEIRLLRDYLHDTSGTESYYGSNPSITRIPDNKQFSVFEGKDRIRAFYHPSHTHDTLWPERNEPVLIDKGNYYHFCVPDTIVLSCTFYTRPVTHPVINTDEVRGYIIDHMYEHANWIYWPDVLFLPHNKSQKLSGVDGAVGSGNEIYYYTGNGDLTTQEGRLILSGDTISFPEPKIHGADGSLYFSVGDWQNGYTAFDTSGRRVAAYTENDIGDFSERYIWRDGPWDFRAWQLLDITTGQPVMSKKEYSAVASPIWDSITIIQDKEHGTRLYNIKRRHYFTAEGYNRIRALDVKGSLFALKTCSGKIGIMRANGTWLSDTIWTSFTPLRYITRFETDWSNDEGYGQIDFYKNYVFSNRTSRQMFTMENSSLVRTDSCETFLWENSTEWYYGNDFDHSFTSDGYNENQREYVTFHILQHSAFRYLPWHQHCIVDSIYCAQREDDEQFGKIGFADEENEENIFDTYYEDLDYAQRTCLYCAKKRFLYQAFMWTRPTSRFSHYLASYVSDSVLSFSAIGTRVNTLYQVSRYYPSNIILFSDGPHNMTIDSLFDPRSEWKNFLVNTVLDYVNTHKDVEGDCHNPAGIPTMLKQEWVITQNGITIYPPGFRIYNAQVAIPLSRNELDPYLRADVKKKMPTRVEN